MCDFAPICTKINTARGSFVSRIHWRGDGDFAHEVEGEVCWDIRSDKISFLLSSLSLSLFLKRNSFDLLDLFDHDITSTKLELLLSIAPCLKAIHAQAESLVNMDRLSAIPTFSELHLNLFHRDYRGDILNFLQHSGFKLKVLELKRMEQPIDICQLSQLCPNLTRIRCAVTGQWTTDACHLPQLTTANLRVKCGASLLSFLTFNESTESLTFGQLKNSNLGDDFVNQALDHVLDGVTIGCRVKKISFSNKLKFSPAFFISFISCFPKLRFIGPAERWSASFSDEDLTDAISHIKRANLNVRVCYKRKIYGDFDIGSYNPWKFRYIIDKGKIPEPKEEDDFDFFWGTDGMLRVVKAEEMVAGEETNICDGNSILSLHENPVIDTKSKESLLETQYPISANEVQLVEVENKQTPTQLSRDQDDFANSNTIDASNHTKTRENCDGPPLSLIDSQDVSSGKYESIGPKGITCQIGNTNVETTARIKSPIFEPVLTSGKQEEDNYEDEVHSKENSLLEANDNEEARATDESNQSCSGLSDYYYKESEEEADDDDEQYWYWDYEENTWVLCDDDDDWDDYEYVDSDEEAVLDDLYEKKKNQPLRQLPSESEPSILVEKDEGEQEVKQVILEKPVEIELRDFENTEPSMPKGVVEVINLPQETKVLIQEEDEKSISSPEEDQQSGVIDAFHKDDIKSEEGNVKAEDVEGHHTEEKTEEKDQTEIEETVLDIVNAIETICMWGHEGCTIKSHFKYDWQSEKKSNLLKDAILLQQDSSEKVSIMWEQKVGKLPDHSTDQPTKREPSKKPTVTSSGLGVKSTLEMLKNRITRAEGTEDREKLQRSIELDKMKKLRQAGITKDFTNKL